jgi:lipoprotein-releasing system ATP-binding protein
MTPVLEARAVAKAYLAGDGSTISVLRDLDLVVEPGEFVSIVGASGSGKSTLLHLLGALDRPTGGAVLLEGRSLAELGPDQLAALRNRRIGFVFQFHHLLRDFTALENVALPLLIGGVDPPAARDRAGAMLGILGLADRLQHYPTQLSGGEQQRVAVARSLVREPAIVLADEPSGNLDPRNAAVLHDLFATLRERFGTAVVVATHNYDLAHRADRILRLESGVLVPEGLDLEKVEA